MKQLFSLLAAWSLTWAGFGADFGAKIDELIPKLADSDVPALYSAQMQLQDLASSASKPGNAGEREALGTALAAKAADDSVPQAARVWIVRQLEYMGGAESVEALTRVMNGAGAELKECARRALEKNPAPAASQSLRAALEKGGEPPWLIGLINSLGQRQDAEAVSLIAPHLSSNPTASVAAQALGRIATAAAVDLLRAETSRNPAAGPSLVEAANRILAQGKNAEAKTIYAELYQPANDRAVRAAAFSGLLRADPSAANRLIKEALTQNEPRLQQIAIQAAGQGPMETQRLLEVVYAQMQPAAKVQILGALSARGEKTILAALSDTEESVRQAAINALGRVGGAESVTPLLMRASGESSPERALANTALIRISGAGALETLRKAAAAGAPGERVAAMNALAGRQDAGAVPVLLANAKDRDETVRNAAYGALGKVGSDKEVGAIAKVVLQDRSEQAISSLEAVARRVKDRPAAANELSQLATKEEDMEALLPVFSVLGDEKALAVAVEHASSGSEESQEKALSALSNWSNFKAVKPLLAIATDPNAPESRYLPALQGVLRLVDTQENEPVSARAEAGLAAFKAARNEKEKKQALAALGSVPDLRVVEAITPLLQDPALKNEAGLAAANLADLLVETNKPAAQELARTLKEANISRPVTQRANAVLKK